MTAARARLDAKTTVWPTSAANLKFLPMLPEVRVPKFASEVPQ